jgi:acetolactate synthase-1/2/3 large subunit
MIWEAKRPWVYAGGGIIAADAGDELRELVELTDAPAVCTLMGLGGLPSSHPNFVSMPGMHGSYAANMGMTETDLIIALGVRFDDRVTGSPRRIRAARQKLFMWTSIRRRSARFDAG